MNPTINSIKTKEDPTGTSKSFDVEWHYIDMVEVFTNLVFITADGEIELLFLNSNE